jgi:hypothetical protein
MIVRHTALLAALIAATCTSCGSAPTGADAGDVAANGDAVTSPDAPAADDSAADVSAEAGGGTDTWANYAQAFFATYCVSCHGPTTTDTRRDYSQLAQVQRDATLIRCGVTPVAMADCASTGNSPRQFPIGTGPHPMDAERTRLVNWILAGAM